jgi:hypothetical protein
MMCIQLSNKSVNDLPFFILYYYPFNQTYVDYDYDIIQYCPGRSVFRIIKPFNSTSDKKNVSSDFF